MGTAFEEMLYSNPKSPDLPHLFREDHPSIDELTQLVEQLTQQQAIDKLSILLALIQEEKDDKPHCIPLITKILNALLIQALNASDESSIKTILNDLTLFLVEQNELWQSIVSSLMSWIERHPQSDLNLLLLHLPNQQRERLYARLLDSVEGTPPWLEHLIHFIFVHRNTKTELNLSNLAKTIILSFTPCTKDQLNRLSLMLNTQELIALTFQLRAMAATYVSNNQENHARFEEHRQHYLNSYDILSTALTIRATTSKDSYEELVANHSELANILMTKRLLIQTKFNQQKELIFELLENLTHYDLSDLSFKARTNTAMVNVFVNLQPPELGYYFKKYHQDYAKKNLMETIRFLDNLFDKSCDKTKLLHCIQSIDDPDKTVIINYITRSLSCDKEMAEVCFSSLNETQLIPFCPHVLALEHILKQGFGVEPLHEIYFRVLCKKITISSFSDRHIESLVATLRRLPEDTIVHSVKIVLTYFKDNAPLRYQWLKALFSEHIPKTMLLESCLDTWRMSSLTEQVSLLRCVQDDEFLELYVNLSRQNLPDQAFQSLIERLKETHKPLLHLLIHTPFIKQSFLDKLIPTIDDRVLMTMIFSLLDKSSEDPNYQGTLNQLLAYFCNRLQLTYYEKATIHQWHSHEKAKKLALYLLDNPHGFHSLCLRSSLVQNMTPSLLQGYLVYDGAKDLKLRANRLLTLVILDEEKANHIALNLLSYYQSAPQKLQMMFINLETGQESLTEEGRSNYNLIKKACWTLLQPKADAYDDKRCVTLLTTQLKTAHCFDPLVKKWVMHVCENQNASLGAEYLTQLDVSTMAQIPVNHLVQMLTNSLSANTESNWAKTKTHFNHRPKEERVSLLKNIIKQVRCSGNNPILMNKTIEFFLSCPDLDGLIDCFDEDELCWLIKESKDSDVIRRFPCWLNQLIESKRLDQLNPGALFALLPKDEPLVSSIYQNERLIPYFAKIFIQLVTYSAPTVHFSEFLPYVIKLSPEKKVDFLTQVQKDIPPEALQASSLLFINMALLSLPTINPRKIDDVVLVLNHLKLIAALKRQAHPTEERSQCHKESEQLMQNTLSYLFGRDSYWSNQCLESQEFAEYTLTWLPGLDSKTIERHPLTKIFIDYAHLRFHPSLISQDDYQRVIKQLLSEPPGDMEANQFSLLFKTLSEENQHRLAIDLLQRPTISPVQWSSLMVLATILPIQTLYTIYTQSKTRFVFVDLLARHPVGLLSLNQEECNTLLADLHSGKQVLRILDSHTSPALKIVFIDAIFRYLNERNISPTQWLENMNIDVETLAAIANFTTKEENKAALLQGIEQDPYLKQRIANYLQNPSLDMPLDRNGLLYQLLQNAALNPELGVYCHPKLMQTLEPDRLRKALKAHFTLLTYLDALNPFYFSCSNATGTISERLISAKWIQCLPLISNGLMDVLQKHQQSLHDEQDTIEQTRCYKQMIAPLFSERPIDSLVESECNASLDLLGDYVNAVQHLDDPLHEEKIKQCLTDYHFNRHVLEHFSDPRLAQIFSPNSLIGKLIQRKMLPLREPDIVLIDTALKTHEEWLQAKDFMPAQEFLKLIKIGLDQPHVFKNRAFRAWFSEQVLFSPLLSHLNDDVLKDLLGQIPNTEFAAKLAERYKKIEELTEAFEQLSLFTSFTTFRELIKFLHQQPLNDLVNEHEAALLAKKPNLTQLIHLIIQAKELDLDESQLRALFPPESLTQGVELAWFHLESEGLKDIKNALLNRMMHLVCLSFSFHGDTQDKLRLEHLKHMFIKADKDKLGTIFNSYLPVFTNKKNTTRAKELLSTLPRLYVKDSDTQELIKALNPELLIHLIQFALNDLAQQTQFLEQIIHADFGLMCERLILETLRPQWGQFADDTAFLLTLSLEQFADLTLSECEKLLLSQQLLFFINPLKELAHWQKKDPTKHRPFCADMSIFQVLITWQDEVSKQPATHSKIEGAQKNLTHCFHFFEEKIKASIYTYERLMDRARLEINHQDAVVYYHWLGLLSWINHDKAHLNILFLNWLKGMDDEHLTHQPYLEKVLVQLLNNEQLPALCQALSQNNDLTTPQARWLLNHILAIRPQDEEALRHIVIGFSWSWLREKFNDPSIDRLQLLQLALTQEEHIQTIIENASSQQTLLLLLNECQFPPNDLIRLQRNTHHTTIKSLISVHLLGRQEYINNCLKKQGMEFEPIEAYFSSPLHPMINQLDLTTTPPNVLQELRPEAALALLCSVRQFHHLKAPYLEPLIQPILKSHPDFIQCWLKHAQKLPNVTTPFIGLLQCQTELTLNQLSSSPESIKNNYLMSTLKHIHQLPRLLVKKITPLCGETHLNQACHLYFYNQNSESILMPFIHDVIDTLHKQKKHLSTETLQLLIRLNEQTKLDSLRDKIKKAMDDYLYHATLFKDCSPFYDDGQLNISRMQKPIRIRHDEPVALKHPQPGFKKAIKNMFRGHHQSIPQPESVSTTHPLIATLAKNVSEMKTIDYFIIRYDGSPDRLAQCLDHYLDALESINPIQSTKQLETTAWLINRSEIDETIRKTVFEAVLKHPRLFNKNTSLSLLHFDAKRIVREFGLKGDYKTLIEICSLGLPGIDEKNEHLSLLNQAFREAKFESSLAEITGFLAHFRIWVKRSFFYGWETWFVPKKPKYVLALSDKKTMNATHTHKREANMLPPPPHQPFKPMPEEGIAHLLHRLKNERNDDLLQAFINALAIYNWQYPDLKELETRESIDEIVGTLCDEAKSDGILRSWLEPLLINNRMRLIECYLETNQEKKLLVLLSHPGMGDFSFIRSNLFLDKTPELIMEPLPSSSSGEKKTPALEKNTTSPWRFSSLFSRSPNTRGSHPSEKSGWFRGVLY